ncbi:hypothetical protein MUP01_11955 [Candidatus Bathyarchaeota archaeon]|nr:hypothetical protein [Candidatus Bathyarchaeota archaeon]
MTMRVESRRDDNGRLLKITIYKGTAKKVQLQFDFAQDEFIDTITFFGRREELPSASEIVALISAKFMERVQTLGNIEDALPTGTNSIGQVTANAGTNLNTSLLALEAGGNLAAILARLDVALSTRALEAGGNLATIAGKDFATQTTLALLKTRADLLATEATLATIHGHVDSIDGKITACDTGAIAGSLTQSTKHDAATYKTVLASLNADGNLVAGVANKLIKLHYLFIMATATVEGDIKDKSGGVAFIHFKHQDREGVSTAFLSYPACLMKSQAVGDPLYVDFSTAAQCYFTAVYTDADAV